MQAGRHPDRSALGRRLGHGRSAGGQDRLSAGEAEPGHRHEFQNIAPLAALVDDFPHQVTIGLTQAVIECFFFHRILQWSGRLLIQRAARLEWGMREYIIHTI